MRARALVFLWLCGCPDFDGAYEACTRNAQCIEGLSSELEVTPSSALFSAPLGLPVSKTFRLASKNDSPVLRLSLTGSTYQFVEDGCSGRALIANGVCLVTVRFSSVSEGTFDGALQVAALSGPPFVRVPLSGEAVDGAAVSLQTIGMGQGVIRHGTRSCPTDCSAVVPRGALLTLDAVASPGSSFAGWEGDCAGTAPCTLDDSRPRSVTARFDPGGKPSTLQLASSGPGRILTSPTGTPCGPGCALFADGQVVNLRAAVVPGDVFSGWTGDCSGTDANCRLVLDRPRSANAAFAGPNVIFTTSRQIAPGAIGGFDGGVAFCLAHARDAGFHGPFIPWLSLPGEPIVSRLGNARGFERVDGVAFALTLPETRAVYFPAWYDERGAQLRSGSVVATGTHADGGTASRTCNGWKDPTSTFVAGDFAGGTVQWTDEHFPDLLAPMFRTCNQPVRLYCLQTSQVSNLPAAYALPASVRRLFLSEQAFSANLGGLTGADARCQAIAADAGLPGTYFAVLYAPDAGTRFAPGSDYHRLDGLRVQSAVELLDPEPELRVAPNVSAKGQHVWAPGLLAWHGNGGDCLGWTSTSSSSKAGVFPPLSSDGLQLHFTSSSGCSGANHLLCAQR